MHIKKNHQAVGHFQMLKQEGDIPSKSGRSVSPWKCVRGAQLSSTNNTAKEWNLNKKYSKIQQSQRERRKKIEQQYLFKVCKVSPKLQLLGTCSQV